MKGTRKYLLLMMVFVLAILVAACQKAPNTDGGGQAPAGSPGAPAAGAKTSVIVALSGEPAGLDPQVALDAQAWILNLNLYDTLVDTDNACSTNIRPNLAESWEVSPDGLVYTFKLRQDVDFHNGAHFTSEDARYTIERARVEHATAAYTTMIDKVEAPDEYTLVITLNTPNADFLQNLGGAFMSIVNEQAITAAGEDYGRQPVGTGPYKFVKWAPGESIVLVANESYFKGAPQIKDVTYRMLPDTSTALIALQKGEIDAFPNTAAVDIGTVENDPNLTLHQAPGASIAYLAFNMTEAPFDDVRVRKAVSLAIDRDEILMGAINGAGMIAAAPLNPLMMGYDPNFPPTHEKDIAKAKELLKEAGYENGFSTTLKVVAAASRDKAAQIVQAQLREIGVDCSVEILEKATFFELLGRGEYAICLGSLNWPDTDHMLTYLYATDGPFNFGQVYSNDRVNELLDKAREATDEQQRIKMYQEIIQITYDDVNKVPLYFINEFFSARKGLNGIEIIDNCYFPVAKWSWSE